jgi:hypothetical protein
MRYGDLSGLNVVYTKDGKPILNGEEIKQKVETKASLYCRDGRVMRHLKGMLYVTDKRVIFIRRPPGLHQLLNEPDLGLATALGEYAETSEVKAKGGYEYIEFGMDEITKVEKKRIELRDGFYIVLDYIIELENAHKLEKN